MKQIITYIFILIVTFSFAQEKEKEKELAKITQNANDLVYDANDLASSDDFILAEMEYRKALSTQPTHTAGAYNLGHSYYKKGNYDEALYRNQQAAKNTTDKVEKHKAFHNIGNILMQNKKCKEAIEAFKNALRNDPTDDETRYNLGLAKECAKNQEPPQEEDDKKDEEKDKKENEDQNDKDDKEKEDEGENKEDNKEKGDDDKKEGEDKEDKGKPEDEKEKDGKGDKEKKEKQKPQQQPGQLSPQQIKNLLEAMNNQEQKVQEKINAEKAKGVKIQTEKDW
ncbi:tetratricopeptide repeat protein [uncultured Lacinutrix sp.]|uniref:tetratricopeptide repeat protein n=1 Tax=uncultured Lacinutrix sp. TaxID=574032 RepID=UPI00261EC8B7|nr:tetratricopeptide repeat protein [uncultured Lacinutrix sp.]